MSPVRSWPSALPISGEYNSPLWVNGHKRGVAQLARATGLGPVGRTFESCHPDQTVHSNASAASKSDAILRNPAAIIFLTAGLSYCILEKYKPN